MKLEESEWNEWRAQPVTRVFFSLLVARREALKDQWAAGAFGRDLQDNAHAVGAAEALQAILDLSFAEVNEELSYE